MGEVLSAKEVNDESVKLYRPCCTTVDRLAQAFPGIDLEPYR